jgi:hypothetical protein
MASLIDPSSYIVCTYTISNHLIVAVTQLRAEIGDGAIVLAGMLERVLRQELKPFRLVLPECLSGRGAGPVEVMLGGHPFMTINHRSNGRELGCVYYRPVEREDEWLALCLCDGLW